MNKPESLRAHLLAAVPELRHNPDRLLVFIDKGRLRSTAAGGLSFEYGYTLNLLFTDYAGHPDAIAIPLLAWLLVNQSELLVNLEKGKEAIQFEADVLANDKVDLSITLPLTERVIVRKQADGTLQVTHAEEPPYTEQLESTHLQVFADGELLAEWDTAAPTGVALETPHPGPTRHG
ncbi:P2 phage tail completion protein R (GpR) [Azotobacter beijerinckii]|uniref:P2 phage tail completion protein R (GpR) n=1 Tax=Azotobacter beijerinckii TaxID=170623 RepID=A0A1H6TTQ4_9GAMM|nr:phage tail protein [Azotobacter beijerinckii]SEI83443.1 P2 phage tail completion protein R (GpR) [Azotobacter beijerinckii]